MELKTLDLFVLITLEKHKQQDLKQLSNRLMLDQAEVSRSLTRLTKYDLVLSDNQRPKKYYINVDMYKKWIKN
jgi:predicted transcriptional regulator